ncbi:hypothetical protein Tco_1469582 [Tanacetum coccineum]
MMMLSSRLPEVDLSTTFTVLNFRKCIDRVSLHVLVYHNIDIEGAPDLQLSLSKLATLKLASPDPRPSIPQVLRMISKRIDEYDILNPFNHSICLCPLKTGKYLHFSLCSGTETKEGLCKELQFSLVDNSKLDDVYLLNRS